MAFLVVDGVELLFTPNPPDPTLSFAFNVTPSTYNKVKINDKNVYFKEVAFNLTVINSKTSSVGNINSEIVGSSENVFYNNDPDNDPAVLSTDTVDVTVDLFIAGPPPSLEKTIRGVVSIKNSGQNKVEVLK